MTVKCTCTIALQLQEVLLRAARSHLLRVYYQKPVFDVSLKLDTHRAKIADDFFAALIKGDV